MRRATEKLMSDALRQAATEYLVRYGGDAFPNLFRSAPPTAIEVQARRAAGLSL